MNYIGEETSKDILKLILIKLGLYYNLWYFGKTPQIDEILLDLLTEVQIKLSGENSLKLQMKKNEVRNAIKQQYSTQRMKLIG